MKFQLTCGAKKNPKSIWFFYRNRFDSLLSPIFKGVHECFAFDSLLSPIFLRCSRTLRFHTGWSIFMNKSILFILLGFLQFKFTQGQEGEYYETYFNQLHFTNELNTNVLELNYANKFPNREFNLESNIQYKYRFTAIYRSIQLFISLSPPFLATDVDQKGRSRSFDFRLSILGKKVSQYFSYSTTKGFFLRSADSFQGLGSIPKETQFVILPNFTAWRIGSETFYYLNPERYSERMAFNRTARQLKTGGSFFVPTYVYYSQAKGTPEDFSFLERLEDAYPTSSNSLNVIGGYGYGINWVLGKGFFVALRASPIVGIQFLKFRFTDETSKREILFSLGARGSLHLGYNGKKFHFGVESDLTRWVNKSPNGDFTTNQDFLRINFGIRINPPKFVEKSYNSVRSLFKR